MLSEPEVFHFDAGEVMSARVKSLGQIASLEGPLPRKRG